VLTYHPQQDSMEELDGRDTRLPVRAALCHVRHLRPRIGWLGYTVSQMFAFCIPLFLLGTTPKALGQVQQL